MRAVVFEDYGGAETLSVQDIPEPVAKAKEVVVKVQAVAVDRVDTYIRSGAYRTPLADPHIIGRDLIGTAVAVGTAVEGFAVGELVWTNSMGYDRRMGATAEYVAVPAAQLFHAPAGVDPVQLIAAVHSAATAAISLRDVMHAKRGEALLVEGAAGNVGRKFVQLAHQAGLRVVGSAAPKAFDRLQALGADDLVDYHSDLTAMTVRFDHIIDTSGQVPLQTNLDLLKPNGEVTLITAPASNQFTFKVRQMYMQGQQIRGFVLTHAPQAQLNVAAAQLNQAFAAGLLLEDDVVVKTFEEAAAVHAVVESGAAHGRRYVLVP